MSIYYRHRRKEGPKERMRWVSDEPPPSQENLAQRGTLSTPGALGERPPSSDQAFNDPKAPYLLPIDLTSLRPEDYLHSLFRQVFKGNSLVPLAFGKESRMLDVGTGTGRWAIEMAEALPNVQVYGLDLQAPQDASARSHRHNHHPANYHFQPGNVLKRLPFREECFAFVHQRFLLASIPPAQWYAVLRELMRVTRPDGWIELVEGGTVLLDQGPATRQWFSWWEALAARSGLDLSRSSHLGELVQQVGLTCRSSVIDLPVGAWGRQVGLLLQRHMLTVYDDFAAHAQYSGIAPTQLQAVRTQLQDEWQTRRSQARFFVVLAEKRRPG